MVDSPATTDLYDRLHTQAHVWFCLPSLIRDEQKLAEYKAVLSTQEIERYQRFRFDKDRHSYLVAHALLRYALSKYAALPASRWQFDIGEHGKPALQSPVLPDLYFNLTHTEDLSACVISSGRRCGIDAENIQRKNKLIAVAGRMFAEEELAQLDEKDIDRQFYYFWTLREAYLKALGTGLAGSSKDFYFEVEPRELSVVMHRRNNLSGDIKSWQFGLYEPTPSHVLAVGVESSGDVQVVMNEFIP